ncbi:type II secretion system minor pseudopilin GspK [Variovorax terrae]|uniref:Type II secretion system protein K n=1 Tax=Variovorax terrae TaxID=2923278 RepID=A0A9X1VX94_9BURK|nr:type II secretion system minor pseudopilin GspK [Variovorax terrae]MCJ0764938.1 type II secretion system minor pseudopilin GspK [Variovorax terrae]
MTGSSPHAGRARAQRGAALLAAMLTVTLVATFAAAALWQQWRNVEVETAERARVQAAWVLTGALDWARLILREDARSGGADHLAEPWAVPLKEARLSSFLAADQDKAADNTTDMQDAFLSGQITDLQSRLNVFNLVNNNQVSEPDFKAFAKLFELLGLPPQQLMTLAGNLRLALSTESSAGAAAPLAPQRVEQLVWLGLSPQVVAVLQPYITLLPARTPVNINTASAEVIYASVPGLELADAQRLVAERDRAHFRTLSDAGKLIGDLASRLSEGQHAVATRFFEVYGRLRLEQTVVQERSVLQRDGIDVKTLWRERGVADPAAQASR